MIFFFRLIHPVEAQKISNDTSQIKRLNPRKATIYSAACPGLGQIYNGKAWKAAIIYAGFTGITIGLVYNQKKYKSYQQALDFRLDSLSSTVDTKYPSLSDGTVTSNRNFHRRNRDICILAFFGFYALNIIDANVDANLQEFSINKDLSLRWQPIFSFTSITGPKTGINFTLTF